MYALSRRGMDAVHFKDTDLRVYERKVANPGSIIHALNKGGIVIPLVRSSLFGISECEQVATLVLRMKKESDEVLLLHPMRKEEVTCRFMSFVEAWDATGGYCTTAFPPDHSTYRPKLIDLTHVELPEEFLELREAIAENAHDMWALERQSEGWTYGPERNDAKLETPDMVPYAQLADSEREYDRLMATDTLRLLVALGYKTVKA